MLTASASYFALVAGGSRGIGYAIARALARRKYNLVLVARGMQDLEKAKQNLERDFEIIVEIISFDLSKEETAPQIAEWSIKKNFSLKVLCNVAGIGGAEDYLSFSQESLWYMIKLNIGSCSAL